MNLIKRILFRIVRCLVGKKGIYGKIGKANHFSKGVIVYEKAEIGTNNYFSPYTLVNNAHIGNYCSIGPNCMIGLGEHDLCAISTYPRMANGNGGMKLFDEKSPTVICNDVWLGAGVVVKQGVKISNGAVIGANSVVTHDIPPYAIAVGVPARVIRYRFDEDVINALDSSRWYEENNLKKASNVVANLCIEIRDEDISVL